MRQIRPLLLLLLLITLWPSRDIPAAVAQTSTGCEHFSQTGHSLCSAFLAYWQGHGAVGQQGYPISEEFTEASPLDGKPYTVQYFERAVFEAHPEKAAPYTVLLSQLGTYRFQQRYPNGSPAGKIAAEGPAVGPNGRHIGGPFLSYWQAHGGVAQQGYPLTDELVETSATDGQPYTVQYFERAVLEYHPQNAAPYHVLPVLLGTLRAQQQYPAGFPAGAAVPTAAPPVAAIPASSAFQKGINYAAWYAGSYNTPAADQALRNLAATGANSLGLVVTQYMDSVDSTTIHPTAATPTDEDLRHVLAVAHSLGLRIMLKPHVDLANGTWRGTIGPAFPGEAQWQAWFASYRDFIGHYADLAQTGGADLLCIGTELLGTTGREADWRAIVAAVRARYHGPLTYASNMTEERAIQWWDAVDDIGVDAYYALADSPNASAEALQHAWQDRGYLDLLQGLAQKYVRPVILTEIGYRSTSACAQKPWEWETSAAPDPQAQAAAYQAAFAAFWGRPWLAGMYWWAWDTNPQQGGLADASFTPYNKPAAAVLSQYYK